MKFKATKIATAVAAGLGLSMVGLNAAKADNILFPHIVLSPTVTTILTVINDDNEALPELHYRYYYNGGSGRCQEFDFWNDTSENDIVTFDLGSYFSGDDEQGVLFEPGRSASSNVNVNYVDNFGILGTASPKRGYVIVDNTPRNPTDPNPAPTAQLAGEAFVIEFITGSAWGYRAYNPSEIWGFRPPAPPATPVGSLYLLNQYDFSDRVEVNGEVLTAAPANIAASAKKDNFWVPISIMPWDEIANALFVTPVGTNMGPNGVSNLTVDLKLRATAEGADRIMFNRDERSYSGPGNASVTCVGRIDLEDMVGELVRQQTPEGGWTNVVVERGEAIVFKAEINESPSWVDVPLTGTFNNIVQLRKGFRESLGRPVAGPVGWNYLPTYENPGIDNNAPYPVWQNILEIPANVDERYNPDNFARPAQVQAAINNGNVFISGAQ